MTEIVALDIGFPGAGRVLRELSKVSSKVTYAGTGISYATDFRASPDRILFLAAWHPKYPELPGKKVIIWTSPPLQSEMVPQELEYLQEILHLLDMGKIHAVWFGHSGWLSLAEKEGRRVFYAPYPCTLPKRWREKPLREKVTDVSLFGPLHPRKNVLNQLIAAKVSNTTVHFTDPHVDQHPEARLVDRPVVSHNWPPYEVYERILLEQIDLGLQCSIPGVESFDFVCWDHLSRGIPCLNSLAWTPLETRLAHDEPEKIAIAIGDPYDPTRLRRHAEDYAAYANSTCLKTLESELRITL